MVTTATIFQTITELIDSRMYKVTEVKYTVVYLGVYDFYLKHEGSSVHQQI